MLSKPSLTASTLYKVAGALNIEGGYPYRDLFKTSRRAKLWVNLVTVLDCPMVPAFNEQGVDIKQTFDEIAQLMELMGYLLLEHAIQGLDENKLMVAYAAILNYYVQFAREQGWSNIVVHVHQGVQHGTPLIHILQRMMADLNTTGVTVTYRTDNPNYQSPATDRVWVYEECDILISFSQSAGLEPTYHEGTLLTPTTFIPFDLDTNTVHVSQAYTCPNALVDDLPRIVASPHMAWAVAWVTMHYVSGNAMKQANKVVTALTLEEFKTTKLLQVDRLWNPKNAQECVTTA